MSVGGSPDNLTFGIRADRSQLGPDLRAARDEVKREVAGMTADAKAAVAREPIKPKFDVSGADAKLAAKQWQKAFQEAVDADDAIGIKNIAAKARDAGVELDVAVGKSKGLKDNLEGGADALDKSTRNAIQLGKAMGIAMVAARALEVAADAIDFSKAFASGDVNAREAAAAQAKGTVEGLPVVGTGGKSLGRIADATGILDITGINTLRGGVAKLAGAQTDAEMKEFDRQQAELKKRLDETDKLIQRGAAQRDAAVAITREIQRELAREGKSATERAAMDARDRLADFDEAVGKRPSGSKTTDEDREARAALEQRVRAADSADAQAKIDQLEGGVREVINLGSTFVDEFSQRVTDAAEQQIRAQSELRAAELQRAGDVDGAEKERFEESVRRRLQAAQQVGDFQVDVINQVAEQERQQLEQTQAERRDKAARQAREEQERLNDQAAQVHQQIADEERARRQGVEDLEASAQDKRLRRMGLGDQADVNEILRRTKRDLEEVDRDTAAAEEDRARERAAILANAREDVLAVEGQAAARPEALIVSGAAALQGIGRDQTQNLMKETNDIQKQALGVLKEIARKAGIAITS